ncbi:thermonuclease family protein [Bartonella sp. cb54]|uniref:thermonuclease family protein n=1 Tax=Bartonella sp. cb54 TaxID=3385560 RepID=UPI0039A6148A
MRKKSSQFYLKSFKLKLIGLSILAAITLIVFVTIYLKCAQICSPKDNFSSQAFIKGNASIIDGDSITISSVIIRLIGIDAPELRQFCGTKESRYPCGLEAKKYLKQLIANQPITCYWYKKDKYHRILATCKTKQVSNINATMVRNGWAVSYYSYPKEEQEARQKKRGIWQSNFQQPKKWRKTHPWTE